VDWLFRDRRTGRIVVFQWPNLPLGAFVVASLVGRILHPEGAVGTAVTVVATATLVWWAGDEVARGVNPFRRVLGGAVLVLAVSSLLLR
jgi:hypothetical protein